MPEQFILFLILIIVLLSILFMSVFTKIGNGITRLQKKIMKELKSDKGEEE